LLRQARQGSEAAKQAFEFVKIGYLSPRGSM